MRAGSTGLSWARLTNLLSSCPTHSVTSLHACPCSRALGVTGMALERSLREEWLTCHPSP